VLVLGARLEPANNVFVGHLCPSRSGRSAASNVRR
jgi:hypothetical protein